MKGMEISSLQQLIREGRYEVEAELVADAIVRSWIAESELYSAKTEPSIDSRAEQLQFDGVPPRAGAVTPTNRAPGPPGVYGRQLPPRS